MNEPQCLIIWAQNLKEDKDMIAIQTYGEHHDYFDIHIQNIVPIINSEDYKANDLIIAYGFPRTMYQAAYSILNTTDKLYYNNEDTDSGAGSFWTERISLNTLDEIQSLGNKEGKDFSGILNNLFDVILIAKPNLPEELDNISYIYDQLKRAKNKFREKRGLPINANK